MHQAMSGMADGKQTGEEQQDSEQTCECGICNPLRANRFSPFLQALPIKHVAAPNASLKSWPDIESESSGMNYSAVSDLNPVELREFADLLK